MIANMDKKAALKFLNKRAQEAKWDEIAAEIGEDVGIVYGWFRRQSIPKWRVQQVEAAAKRHANV